MKNYLLLAVTAAVLLVSCYGKKLKINDKSEVYYKDGATEAEAKKLGDYLLQNEYFDANNARTVQLLKQDSTYIIKFVTDRKLIESDTSYTGNFQLFGFLIKTEVFANKPVKVELADESLETYKIIPDFNIAPTETEVADEESKTANEVPTINKK